MKKRRLLTMLLALVALVCALTCAAFAAEVGTEDNPVALKFGEKYKEYWAARDGEAKVYEFTLSEQGVVALSAYVSTSYFADQRKPGQMYIEIVDRNGNTVWDTDCTAAWTENFYKNNYTYEQYYDRLHNDTTDYTFYVGLAAGTYRLLLSPSYRNTSTSFFAQYTADPYCEVEPNEVSDTATLMELNHFYTGYYGSRKNGTSSEDWWRVDLESGKEYRITLDWDELASTSAQLVMIDPLGPTFNEFINIFKVKKNGGVDDNGYLYYDFKTTISGTYTIQIYNANYAQRKYGIEISEKPHEHIYGDTEVIVAPTCVAEGVGVQICQTCGATKNVTVPATGVHTWDKWVTTVAPTCVETGTKTKTCEVCGATETATVSATGEHTWSEWTVVSAATPNYPGSQTHTCTVCGTEETVEIPATGNLFTDVHEGDYFYDSVLWAADHGITTGKSATRFAPADTCTRAQVVTFLWRAAGSREPQTTENPFTDVAEGSYYYKAVLWGYENGIVKGTSDTTFEPDKVINREQAVTFIWRCYGSPDPQNASCPFADVGSNYAYNAILWAVEQNVTQGTSATTFAPKNSCTRGQIVTFLYRAMH